MSCSNLIYISIRRNYSCEKSSWLPIIISMFLFLLTFITFVLNAASANGNDENLCPTCKGIIVDTDCGADDAMAISLLLRAEALGKTSSFGKVIGITTVTGNTGAANASRNVEKLLSVLERTEIPVYRGSEDGLAASIQPTWFYGYDGLGDFLPPLKPSPLSPSDTSPGLYIASQVQRYPERITILCIGPLTNLAMALHFNEEFFNQVKHILILGGSYQGGGNMGPGVEANMYSDPDAAAFFFGKIPITATHKVTLLPLEPIEESRFPLSFRLDVLGSIKSNLIDFLNKSEHIAFPKYGGTWISYDPTAAGILIDNKIAANSSLGWVEVVNQGPRGAMFAVMKDRSPNVKIITKINQEKITKTLKHYLASD